VVAQIDGPLASLWIDGKLAAQLLVDNPPRSHRLTLYTWTGTARFDDLRVWTSDTSSPLPPELADAARYGKPTPQTLAHLRDWTRPTFAAGRDAAVERATVALSVDPGPHAKPGMAWPITRGIPFPPDTLYDPDHVRLLDADGSEIPTQRAVTATWSEGGAIRWLLLDFILRDAARERTLTLEYGRSVRAAPVSSPVLVKSDEQSLHIDSGMSQWVVSRTRGSVIESAMLRRKPVLGAAEGYFITVQGERYATGNGEELSVEVETAGAIRTVIRSRGWYLSESGRRACYFVRRLHVYRGLPWARLVTSFVITVDTNAYTFRDIGVRFALAESAGESASRHAMKLDDATPPWITARGGNLAATLACHEMARHFPAGLTVQGDAMTFHAFSNAAGYDLDLTLRGLTTIWGESEIQYVDANRGAYPAMAQRNANGVGLAKTHELMILLHDARNPGEAPAMAFQDPPLVSADPAYVCATGEVGPGPYHPYDPQRFPREEQFIEQHRDRLLTFVDRVTPLVGWWDYGTGNPHLDVAEPTLAERYRIDGYRRTYDMGYQQPLSPWMMYLRSGQRQWLRYAIRNARGLADSRIQHWTHPAYAKRVGWSTQDHGAFPWDTNLAEWGFNIYTPFLLNHYWVTGDERAMDEHTLVLDAFAAGGQAYYVAAVGVWMGNTAAAWRATWNPAYKQKFLQLQRDMLDCVCAICGGVNNNRDTRDEDHDYHGTIHRAAFVEYGIVEAMRVEGHDPRLRQILVTDGQRRLETGEAVGDNVMAYARLLAFEQSGDLRSAREAADVLERMTTFPPATFTYYHGLSSARHLPVLMHLAARPGLESVQIPASHRYSGTLYIQHRPGRSTHVQALTAQKLADVTQTGVSVARLDGVAPPPSQTWYDPVLGRVHLRVEASEPAAVYVMQLPAGEGLRVIHEPDQPIMIGVPHGYQHLSGEPMPRLFFRVPAGVRQFRVRNSLPVRTVTLTAPDGRTFSGSAQQPWLTVDVPLDNEAAWSMQVEHTEHYNFQALKLYDIPPLVALTPRSLFTMEQAPALQADYQPMPFGGSFTAGVMGQALHLRGTDELSIPLGDPTGSTSRVRLDTARGTIEFFFMLNADPVFCGVHSLPMSIAADPSATMSGWTRNWFGFYKNAALFMTPDGRDICGEGARFGPWDPGVGMTRFEPGRWHHIAVLWDSDKPLQEGNVLKRKNQVRVYVDGRLSSNGVYDAVQWLGDAYAAPLPAEVIRMAAEGRDVLIDELRISDVERVPFTKVGAELTYPVPRAPYNPDEHTRLLLHLDGDVAGAGPGGAFVGTLRAGN
jgi:hypothetical protein